MVYGYYSEINNQVEFQQMFNNWPLKLIFLTKERINQQVLFFYCLSCLLFDQITVANSTMIPYHSVMMKLILNCDVHLGSNK
jgi:hypothetical protein